MRYTYCPDCGAKLTFKEAGDDGMVPYCEHCAKYWFDTFSSAVIVMSYNEFGEIALSWQHYLSDKYAGITSGFMTPGETAEESAIREVKEELGLDVEKLEYVGTKWFAPKDLLMHMFLAYTPKAELKLSSEVDEARWVAAEDLPKYAWPDSPHNAIYPIYRKYMEQKSK